MKPVKLRFPSIANYGESPDKLIGTQYSVSMLQKDVQDYGSLMEPASEDCGAEFYSANDEHHEGEQYYHGENDQSVGEQCEPEVVSELWLGLIAGEVEEVEGVDYEEYVGQEYEDDTILIEEYHDQEYDCDHCDDEEYVDQDCEDEEYVDQDYEGEEYVNEEYVDQDYEGEEYVEQDYEGEEHVDQEYVDQEYEGEEYVDPEYEGEEYYEEDQHYDEQEDYQEEDEQYEDHADYGDEAEYVDPQNLLYGEPEDSFAQSTVVFYEHHLEMQHMASRSNSIIQQWHPFQKPFIWDRPPRTLQKRENVFQRLESWLREAFVIVQNKRCGAVTGSNGELLRAYFKQRTVWNDIFYKHAVAIPRPRARLGKYSAFMKYYSAIIKTGKQSLTCINTLSIS